MSENILLRKIHDLFLSSDGADVWFVFVGERLPGHKFILTTMSPWLNAMFNGSLPEGEEVDIQRISAIFVLYTQKSKFTIKQSLCEEFFVKCEEFLIKSRTVDELCYIYELALLY